MNDWGKINTFNMSLPRTNVKIKVCGQSLGYLGLEKKEVLSSIVSTYFPGLRLILVGLVALSTGQSQG